MSWRTKDSRVKIMFKRKQRSDELARRQPLWEQRGNNPPNHIGYLDTKTRDIYTARGSKSVDQKVGYLGLVVDGNNTHERRVAAAVAEDFTYRA